MSRSSIERPIPRNRAMRAAVTAVLIVAASAAPAAGQAASEGPDARRVGARSEPPRSVVDSSNVVAGRILSDGIERTFLVHAPADLPSRPGLVIVFHGAGGDGARVRGFLGRELEPLAARHGFVVIYPDGFAGHWNDCRAATPYPARQRNIDDAAFVRRVIAWAAIHYGIDASAVRAVGFSNGGHFAYRLALEGRGMVEAVAVFGASLPVARELDCARGPVRSRVLVVSGTADPVNPYAGGTAAAGGVMLGRVRPAVRSAHDLARHAGHRTPPLRDVLLARRPDGRSVERIRWLRCGAPDVVLVTVRGGGHTIPGSSAAFPAWLGPVERSYDAIGEAVRLFERPPCDPAARTRPSRETQLKSR
jgi:polyhydroxybutyrate depolymerase